MLHTAIVSSKNSVLKSSSDAGNVASAGSLEMHSGSALIWTPAYLKSGGRNQHVFVHINI